MEVLDINMTLIKSKKKNFLVNTSLYLLRSICSLYSVILSTISSSTFNSLLISCVTISPPSLSANIETDSC